MCVSPFNPDRSAINVSAKRSRLQVLELVGVPLRSRDVSAIISAALASRPLYKLTLAEVGLDDDGCEGVQLRRAA
jgi:hypothetical protein